MAGTIRADGWANSLGLPYTPVIKFQYHKWQDLTTTNSTSYVDVIGSTFSYTPKRKDSILKITGEVSISPLNSGSFTGQNYAIFVNGVEQGKQTNAHEVYVAGPSASADIYVGHNIKSIFYPVSSTSALTINIKTRVYSSTTVTGRINQGSQWESYIYVWEFAQ